MSTIVDDVYIFKPFCGGLVEEALRIYTINAAYASFDEKIKGSIEAGKLADLVVLSDDLRRIEPRKIKDVR